VAETPECNPEDGRPFTDFARYYDRFMMKYVDYRAWVDYIVRVFGRYRVEPEKVLDVACGTGIPTLLMARRGYEMVGVDRAEDMLAVLEEKRGDLPVNTVRADITRFELDRPVDAAVSFYDSINYLLTDEDLLGCFRCVRAALKPGGLFAFDMNTVYSLSMFWGNKVTPRRAGGIDSVWENSYDPKTRISTLHLNFWEDSGEQGSTESFYEEHKERAYSRSEVRGALKEAGFEKVRFYNHGGFLPVGPLTVRMLCVAL
jgi:ubiquinone/menaquinone biosynthesis C-methylase UbiE